MRRLVVFRTGLALAVTAALVNSFCAAAVASWPEESIRLANTWSHGLDLQLIKSTVPQTLGGFAYGLAAIAAISFVVGSAFAWLYNVLNDFGGSGE